ncbi:MAG: ABC transporter permease [Desulfitobacteriaceae bacterium]
MRAFIIRRLIQMVITMFVLMTMLFFMFRILPGDPTTMLLDAALPVEAQNAVRHQFGLDKPLSEQYELYMVNLAHGEFGISFNTREPVSNVIMEKLWNTIFLMGFSVGVALLIGIFGGALVAWFRGTAFEAAMVSIVLFFRSSPVFWIGMMALALFSYKLGWFPIGGMHEPGQNLVTFREKYLNLEFLHHLILPGLVGAFYYIADPLLIMRSSTIEVMEDDFVEMARAKGLPERAVMFRHAIRNSMLPVVTQVALLIGFAIGGQVLVETVFNWPGIGREIVTAIQLNDYPVAQATFFLMGVLVIILNFLTDLVYGVLDPRVTFK